MVPAATGHVQAVLGNMCDSCTHNSSTFRASDHGPAQLTVHTVYQEFTSIHALFFEKG